MTSTYDMHEHQKPFGQDADGTFSTPSPTISRKEAISIMPKRQPDSHKGENGRVGIIGGSKMYYGAPILSAIAALKSGCDLSYLAVPNIHYETAKSYYPDFIVSKFQGAEFSLKDVPQITDFLEVCDSVVIGPGMTKSENVSKAIIAFLKKTKNPSVLDSFAIYTLKKMSIEDREIVITPHLHELSLLLEESIKDNLPGRLSAAQKAAQKYKVIVLLKGQTDIISSPDGRTMLNKTGNSGMTVGGTGDVLAGILGNFLAQKLQPFDAACLAAYIGGSAGDFLYKKYNVFFTASDLAAALPEVLAELNT